MPKQEKKIKCTDFVECCMKLGMILLRKAGG